MDGLSIPSDIDAVVETHSHTDHCGAIAEVVSKNPDAPVFAPP
jgi:glyoxylase-like metal-dependent hydrolase (beta-lactamase superfamily II)